MGHGPGGRFQAALDALHPGFGFLLPAFDAADGLGQRAEQIRVGRCLPFSQGGLGRLRRLRVQSCRQVGDGRAVAGEQPAEVFESGARDLGELLRRWRRSQGLKQIELGRLLKPRARAATVSCLENDLRRPSRRYVSQLVDLTGIPADLALGAPPHEDILPETESIAG